MKINYSLQKGRCRKKILIAVCFPKAKCTENLQGKCSTLHLLKNKQLKVVTSEKIGGSGVTSTLGTWYGGVVMGVLLSFNEAAILYRDLNSVLSQKQNNSICS
jgi:hypothetical protein